MQQYLLKIGKIVKFDDYYCIEEFLSLDGTLKLGEPTPDAMIDFINQVCQKCGENGVDPNYAMKDLPLAYAQWRLPSPIKFEVLSKKFKEIGPHIRASKYSDAEKVTMLWLTGLQVKESFVESVPSTPSGGAEDDREERSTPEERAQSSQDALEQVKSRKRAAADGINMSSKRAVSRKAGPKTKMSQQTQKPISDSSASSEGPENLDAADVSNKEEDLERTQTADSPSGSRQDPNEPGSSTTTADVPSTSAPRTCGARKQKEQDPDFCGAPNQKRNKKSEEIDVER